MGPNCWNVWATCPDPDSVAIVWLLFASIIQSCSNSLQGLKIPATVVNERSHCLGSVKTRGPHYISLFLEDTYQCWNGVCGSTRFPTETWKNQYSSAKQKYQWMDLWNINLRDKNVYGIVIKDLPAMMFGTTSISTSQRMRYSKVMQCCDVSDLSVSHVVFFMMSSTSSGTSQSRKGCSERNSDSDKSVWGGFWSEPWANVLLWGAVFFPPTTLYLTCLGLCTSSRNTPPTALSILFSTDQAGSQLEMYSLERYTDIW